MKTRDVETLQKITERPISFDEVTPDILVMELPLVNVCLVGDPRSNAGEWVLIGAGTAHAGRDIIKSAEARFGPGSVPKAIILSHGHFDHVGSIMELLDKWSVPVYAHELELPYLTGQMDYPPPDPSAGDGLIAQISPLFSNKGINLGTHVHALPSDQNVPWMPGWRWIHTPGHSPGHVSFYRESDSVLIAGDALTTLRQDSAESVLAREKMVSGPPAYFTPNWDQAEKSVRALRELNPQIVISSHGLPMTGIELSEQLTALADRFPHPAMSERHPYDSEQRGDLR